MDHTQTHAHSHHLLQPHQPRGVHLVGSVPLPNTTSVFDYLITHLPQNLLSRMPDGETGERWNFIGFQFAQFPPKVLSLPFESDTAAQPTHEEIMEARRQLPTTLNSGYDTAALESYAVFSKLKSEGAIAPHVKFQVSLPTTVGLVLCMKPPYQAAVEQAWGAALLRALARIQAEIPPQELAIQWDMATDVGMLEGLPGFQKWWEGDVGAGVLERTLKLVEMVDESVEMGFHLCYGDYGHRHFFEPKDTGTLVRFFNALVQTTGHPVQWVHMPVPKERDDVEYFEPLRELKWEEGKELYLGLVHAEDLEGTKKRIEAAHKAGVKTFGVSTECGLGRTPREQLDSVFEIFAEVAKPLK